MLAVVLAGALAISGCGGGGSEDQEEDARGGTLTIGLAREFGSLDPAVDSGASGGAIALYLAFEPLIRREADGTFSPGLAEEFGYVGEGNKAYELKLRDGAKFADGTPVDAAAIKKWLEYVPTAPGTTTGGNMDIASIETPDDSTVRINLNTPTPLVADYLCATWGNPASPNAVDDPDAMTAGPPGAGPYTYDPENTFTGKGATYTLVPNEHYYNQDEIHWDKVVVKVIEDPATMLRAVQSGEIDVSEGSLTTYEAAADAGLNVTTAKAGFAEIVILDNEGTNVEPLGDERVLQALNYAVDRETIAETLFHGAAEPTSTIVGSDYQNPDLVDYYPYDPEKAKALLAEAGYPDGFSFGIVAQTSGTVVGKPLTQAIAQNWADIGVELDILEPATTSELFDKFLSREAYLLEYQTQLFQLLSNRSFPDSFVNPYKVSYPEIEDILLTAQTAPPEDQEGLMYEAAQLTAEQGFSVPITTRPSILVASDKVDGVEASDFMFSSPISREWTPAS